MAKKQRIDKILSNIGCGSRAEIKRYYIIINHEKTYLKEGSIING